MSSFFLASFLDISPTFGKRTKLVAGCSKTCFWIGEPQLVSCLYSGFLSRNPTLSNLLPQKLSVCLPCSKALPVLPPRSLGFSQLGYSQHQPYPGRSYLGSSPEHRGRQGCMKPRLCADHQGALEQPLESLGLSFLFCKLAWSEVTDTIWGVILCLSKHFQMLDIA